MDQLFSTFIDNITLTILRQIGLDANKLSETRNVIRSRIKKCPLFTEKLDLRNVVQLKESFSDFVDECLYDVLDRIV